MSSSDQQEPGLVSGHAQYVKGAAVEAVGNVTGSEDWRSSGASQKAAGEEEMKRAGEQRDPSTQGYGKVEEVAGKAFGCEGMEEEGKKSKSESS